MILISLIPLPEFLAFMESDLDSASLTVVEIRVLKTDFFLGDEVSGDPSE